MGKHKRQVRIAKHLETGQIYIRRNQACSFEGFPANMGIDHLIIMEQLHGGLWVMENETFNNEFRYLTEQECNRLKLPCFKSD